MAAYTAVNQRCPHSTAVSRTSTVALAVRAAGISVAVASPAPRSSASAAATLASRSAKKSIWVALRSKVFGTGAGSQVAGRVA